MYGIAEQVMKLKSSEKGRRDFLKSTAKGIAAAGVLLTATPGESNPSPRPDP